MPTIRTAAGETDYIHIVKYYVAVEITDQQKGKWGNFKFRTKTLISQVIVVCDLVQYE